MRRFRRTISPRHLEWYNREPSNAIDTVVALQQLNWEVLEHSCGLYSRHSSPARTRKQKRPEKSPITMNDRSQAIRAVHWSHKSAQKTGRNNAAVRKMAATLHYDLAINQGTLPFPRGCKLRIL